MLLLLLIGAVSSSWLVAEIIQEIIFNEIVVGHLIRINSADFLQRSCCHKVLVFGHDLLLLAWILDVLRSRRCGLIHGSRNT